MNFLQFRRLSFCVFSTIAAAALAAAIFTDARAIAADASPVAANRTDPTGYALKDRFNELYSGTVTASTLTYAATTNIDMAAAGFQTVTLTGNVTFTTSNPVAGRTTILRVIASGGSRNLTLPGGWVNIGAAAPTAVASGKTGIFVLRAFGTSDASVVYHYEVQP